MEPYNGVRGLTLFFYFVFLTRRFVGWLKRFGEMRKKIGWVRRERKVCLKWESTLCVFWKMPRSLEPQKCVCACVRKEMVKCFKCKRLIFFLF